MNVLVLGISGMLGHKLFQLLQSTGHNVSGVMRPSESDFIDYVKLKRKQNNKHNWGEEQTDSINYQ